MKLFLHVGMGKTGTSSIQSALRSAETELHAQGLHYLGMWFTIVRPQFDGIPGMRRFMQGDAQQLANGANAIVAKMEEVKAKTGCETFVFSNEDLYGNVDRIEPLITALAEKVDLQIVLYIRDIQDWLPSAYVQWAIRHKTRPGPIKPFKEEASRWVGTFRTLAVWEEKFGHMMTYRKFDKTVDVVEDFGQVIGAKIPPVEKRVLERAEDAELILRALFNTKFPKEVFPERFNTYVVNPGRFAINTLEEAIEKYLTYEGGAEIFKDDLEDFRQLGDRIGVDFTSGQEKASKERDVEALRNRLLEYLIEVSLSQSVQLQRMMGRIARIEKKLDME